MEHKKINQSDILQNVAFNSPFQMVFLSFFYDFLTQFTHSVSSLFQAISKKGVSWQFFSLETG